MKFLHLSDLHFGKIIHGISLLENGDQQAWLNRFLKLVQDVHPDAILIAGDIYDRSSPSEDAVVLLDAMVTALAEMEIPLMLIAGNHDSGRRLSFGGNLLARQSIHISGVFDGNLPCVTLEDQDGPVHFWLMPYVFPSLVAQVLEDDRIRDYDTAVRTLLSAQDIDFTQRNILVAHQNVTANGKEVDRGGSESMVGGVGQVDYHAFDGFDYVALGHIHSSYSVGRNTVRYAGSPLCYHFDETKQPVKGPVLVTLGAKGTDPVIETKVIPPLHPMREIRGSFEEIRASELQNSAHGEYIKIVLTDRRPDPEIYSFFYQLFENRGSILMELCSEYNQFSEVSAMMMYDTAQKKSVEDLFMEFYSERQFGKEPDEQEQKLLHFVGEQVRNTSDSDSLEQQAEALLKFMSEQEVTQ